MIIIMDPEMMAMDSGSYVGGNKLKNTCYGRNIGKFSERLGQVAGLFVLRFVFNCMWPLIRQLDYLFQRYYS